ncbi:MAG: glycosyltransferase family 39 protein [Fuerstiella sp.]|nr:glycosyltransferase family 39 protein [Fuerstiella sp.]
MATTDDLSDGKPDQRWLWLVWSLLFAAAAFFEFRRLYSSFETPVGPMAWLLFWDPETTLPFVCLLSLPLLRWVSDERASALRRVDFRIRRADRDTGDPQVVNRAQNGSCIAACCLIFLLSVLSSYAVGTKSVRITTILDRRDIAFADLPPAYHDEYSYLLQAQTFLAGRMTFPPMTIRPDLFHQMHVLNERRTVSRYFPMTGVWMAPFVAFGRPIWGHWLAGGLASVFFYLAMRQIVHPRAACVGGVLIAISPGLAVFSNLLLAHHPVMLALSVFTWSFLRMMSTSGFCYAVLSGTALSCAMLGRPMTAAGFAMPFGLWLAVGLVRERTSRVLAVGVALPIVAGLTVLATFNYEATGSWNRTAYQEYTDTFTPRHRYGFNNGAARFTDDRSKVLASYDKWATNLTPAVAAENVRNRFVASLQWSLAVFPLLFGLGMTVPLCRSQTTPLNRATVANSTGLRLLFASVLTLHLVHVPYWFDGIMHWHYVFETAPLLLLLAGVGLYAAALQLGDFLPRKIAVGWVVSLVAVGLLPGWIAIPVFDGQSKVSGAVHEIAFARTRFEYFNATVESSAIDKPALILIHERDSDPQLSYVINAPDLGGTVLKCRHPKSREEVLDLQAAFPGRSIYTFSPATQLFRRWQNPSAAE